MRKFKGTRAIIVVSASALVASAAAGAGEVLRLKAGPVRLQDASESILMSSFSQNGAPESQEPLHFVVQLEGRVTEAAKAALTAEGLRVERYLPDDAVIVTGSAKAAGLAKSAVAGVRAVSPLLPEWKLSPAFEQQVPEKRDRILVSAVDAASLPALDAALDVMPGTRRVGAYGRDVLVETSEGNLQRIAELDGVEWIEPAPVFVTFDFQPTDSAQPVGDPNYQFTGYESGTKIMGFEQAWARGYKGEGQIAAVADTGLDSGDLSTLHPDFQGEVLKGYAMGLGGSSWADSMGHGTHVSGSIVGNGTRSDGHIQGGAHGGKLIMEGMWSDILNNLAPPSDFGKLVAPAYSDGARIHSNSWGNPSNLGDYDTFASRVDQFMWENPDMLVFFAAGNSGVDADHDGHIDEGSVSSPGTAKDVMTVGASENLITVGGIQKQLGQLRNGDKNWGVEPLKSDRLSDNPNGIACFSSVGPTKDGRVKPDIVAPGTNIISVHSQVPGADPLWGLFSQDYAYSGGTSMATPLAAGAGVVTREYLVKARGFADPSAALVKATMIHSAKDLYPGQYGTGPQQELATVRPNVHEGYGRVDVDATTKLGAETQFVDDTTGVATSEEKTVATVDVKQGQSLRATMVYTDAPAAAEAAKALVNDIDLKVTGPDGHVSQLADRVNNVEMLELKGLAAGEYKVSVAGVNIPQGKDGKQPFAVVISAF